MIGIALAYVATTGGDYLIHRYVLHGRAARSRRHFFHYHVAEHHREARRHRMYDRFYRRPILGNHAQGREALALAVAALVHAPLLPVAPFYTLTTWYLIARYHRVHKRAHLDPEWGRRHLPWHYDHHCGPDPHANWGVISDWIDRVAGTRVRYSGTELERADRARADSELAPG